MNEDIKTPDHLNRFPCMCPWIGPKYKCSKRRLAIVAERHYLPSRPRRVTCLNHYPEKWYAARQEDVLDEKGVPHPWMNTRTCVEHKSDNPRIYRKIENVLRPHGLSFDDIAFFNYVFRPTEKEEGFSQGRLFKILDEDRKVSSQIMEWFIRKRQPTAIVIASTTVIQHTCVRCDLAAHPEIDTCMTNNPVAWRDNRFAEDVQEFLKNPSYRGSRAKEKSCLDDYRARCRS